MVNTYVFCLKLVGMRKRKDSIDKRTIVESLNLNDKSRSKIGQGRDFEIENGVFRKLDLLYSVVHSNYKVVNMIIMG